MIHRFFVLSFVLGQVLVVVSGTYAGDLIIDNFTAPVAMQTLSAGDPPIQAPATDTAILGGERDMQLFVGYGPAGENWRAGVDPARGLYWDNDPNMHVNMFLEWDGCCDGTTVSTVLPADPLNVDLTAFTAFRWEFSSNSHPLQLQMTLGNRPPNGIPPVTGASQTPVFQIPGGQQGPFTFDVPFAAFAPVFAPFLPAADFSDVNVIVAFIGSDMGVEGNNLEIRSLRAVVPEPAACTWIPVGVGLLVGFGRRPRRL